mgnify:CR=1 FL=1
MIDDLNKKTIFKLSSNASIPDNISYKTESRLENLVITEEEVKDILKSLDTEKATGPDCISAKMLKETAENIGYLSNLI